LIIGDYFVSILHLTFGAEAHFAQQMPKEIQKGIYLLEAQRGTNFKWKA
jgi:hypothetical protein